MMCLSTIQVWRSIIYLCPSNEEDVKGHCHTVTSFIPTEVYMFNEGLLELFKFEITDETTVVSDIF